MKEILLEHRCEIIGVQETIKQDFSDLELRALTPAQDFKWEWLPAQGHFGGILLGVKDDILQVEEWKRGLYSTGVSVRNKTTNLRWKLVTMYGPADHSLSREFMQELRDICQKESLPIVIGGDFNLVLEVVDKSTHLVNMDLMEDFNKCIEDLAMMEIKRAGSKFTWTNKQANPIFSNIDRIFASTEWENKFPNCSAYSILRVGSNHSPIILDTGNKQ